MLDFFLGELRRFRSGAAAYAMANLLVLAVLQQMVDIPNGPVGLHVIMVGVYMVTGRKDLLAEEAAAPATGAAA